jgi:putative inorganic carbon (hco3(-)) transporter
MQIVAGQEDDFRIAGPIGDPNFYSQVLLVLVPLAMDRMRQEKKKALRMLAGYTLAVCVFSIFMTFSRGAFLSMIIVIVMMLIKNPPKPLTFLIAIAIVVPLFSVLPPSYTARLKPSPTPFPG